MADYPNTDPRENVRYRTTEPQSGASLLFIVGGLVVAVAFIIWLVVGNSTVAPTVVPATDGNDVIIDNTAPPATTDSTTDTTPAAPDAGAVTPDSTAPADTDAAPADPDATAPANPNAPTNP